jgi:heme-degrading monooxygenase HmoA
VGAPVRIELFAGSPRGGGALHRALREDVAFPFVAVGGSEGAAYEVVHEDGAPEGTGGVVLIDPFEVPPDADAAFLADWHAARAALAAHRGYQGTRLYRAVGPAEFRFVSFSRWSSPLAFARAAGGPSAAHPAMYLLVPG